MALKSHFLVLLLLISLTSGISHTTGLSPNQQELEITATTTIVADAVQNIGGDLITVTTMIGVGLDPHDFEPTPSDITTINESDYIFWTGGGAEESLEDVLTFWEEEGKSTALIESINETDLIQSEVGEDHDHGQFDPHFWMDPVIWKTAAEQIASDLISLLPDKAEQISANLETYTTELDNLHTYIGEQVNKLAEDQKYLVTQHASLSYFTDRYGFIGKSLQGISTDSEAGIQEIEELADYLVENDIEVVFTESTTPGDNIEAVLDAARAQGHQVVIGGQLLVGSLGSDQSTDTYIEMMQSNTDTIVSAILNPPEATADVLPLSSLGIGIALIFLGVSRKRRIVR